MKVVFFVREIMPEGGVTLATFRLATALMEAGTDVEVLYCAGEPPPAVRDVGRLVPGGAAGRPQAVRRSLERADPSLLLIGSGQGELADLKIAAQIAPTLLHAHLHIGTCADLSRYWYRLQRPCSVRAGWKCAALRPVLGCAAARKTLSLNYVTEQRRLLEELSGGTAGLLCVSSSQSAIYAKHGVSNTRMATLPNLGIRADAPRLAAAAAEVPEQWRGATAFIGRLAKTKGAQLLGQLARELSAEARLRVFGDGYLAPKLASLPTGMLCGHVSQSEIMGVLMWARAVVFPSLWPEPGGIVGVDAQLAGVPLAAFDVGAPRFWPDAEHFARGDMRAMASWLNRLDPVNDPREPEEVAMAQAAYWSEVGERARSLFSVFAANGCFDGPTHDGAVEEHLIRGSRARLR